MLARWLKFNAVGAVGILVPANLLAIATTSIANFLLSEFLVFRRILSNKP